MERRHEDTRKPSPAERRGYSGEGERPWVAVWLVLLERAMLAEGGLASRKEAWKASLGAFLLEFRRHPGRLSPRDIREYLFRRCELGSADAPRSLTTAMAALAFFYRAVVRRPALAEAAERPFDQAPRNFFGDDESFDAELPDRMAGDDSPLLALLRERLVGNGASAYCAASDDWRPV